MGAEEIARKEVSAEEVAPYLKLLPRENLRALRAAIRFYQVAENSGGEMQSYGELLERIPGTWPEISRYLDLLVQENQNKKYGEVLEASVGAWLADSSEQRSADQPGAELLMRLFEFRKSDAREKALLPLDFLLSQRSRKKEIGFPDEMIVFKKAETLLQWGRAEEAKKEFQGVITMAPESLWARRASTELKGLDNEQKKSLR